MIVMNRATSKTFFVTSHAKTRFNERSDIQQGDLMTRLSRAVPYGGQKGDDLLLIDEDVVFAANIKDNVILTCLTQEQAVVNMQLHRHKVFNADAVAVASPVKQQPVKQAEPAAIPADIKFLNRQILQLKRDIIKHDRNRCLMKVAMEEILTKQQIQAINVRVKELKAECRTFEEN